MQYEYINKDISWLSFNQRVLDEAADSSLSVSERLRFLAIFSNNLDEFYHFKVFPYIKKQSPIAITIKDIVTGQQSLYIKLLNDLLHKAKDSGVFFLEQSFKPKAILSYLKFLSKKDLSFNNDTLKDNHVYLLVKHINKRTFKEYFTIIEVSSSCDNIKTILFIEDIIKNNIDILFNDSLVYSVYAFKILRHLNIKTRGQGSSLDFILEGIEERKKAGISALFYDSNMSEDDIYFLEKELNLSKDIFIPSAPYLRFSDFLSLFDSYTDNDFLKPSIIHHRIEKYASIIEAAEKEDLLIHYPYHSFDYLILLLREASLNKSVKEISITWYRASRDSQLIDLLIAASRNSKKVKVVMELKAKLEEEKNIAFARKMQDEGVEIIYTNLEMKVHSKMLLIKLDDNKEIAYLSTGNFNEKTAKAYTDHSLITSSKLICRELSILFDEIIQANLSYAFKNLLISPINLKSSFKDKILREIKYAKEGKESLLIFKMNGLQDKEMIDLLYRASESGVKVKLMVRGMCRLLPNMPYSKNISLVRLVDRYLEHGRIYYFHNAGNCEIYMGSADLMTKKLERRVELVFPILDSSLKKELRDILDIYFSDNQKLTEHSLIKSLSSSSIVEKRRAQEDLCFYLKKKH